MFFDAKNENINLGNTDMDFISFGNGDKYLVMIPGLGDGIKTVRGTASAFAMMYRCFAHEYKVYVFSRKNHLESDYSTRDMAMDYKAAMDMLNIPLASVMGISQGGMIAQYMAIDYPFLVEKLVLAVTLSRQNDTIQNVIGSWLNMAEQGDYKSIFIDTVEKSYTEERLKKYRPLYSFLGRVGKPKDLSRFIIQANSCMNHDAYNELDKIKCPTLVIGAENDNVVGANASEEIALRVGNSRLIMYKGFGHGVYEEASDFNQQVLEFLRSEL